ncbi:hypothetical protein GWK47_045379 [Chionoecetes opilio]|uniref:Uncharacterized protein n=1 Tax=Chionoecetes opilio TaxID=41210 RepID=A0A8J5CXM0_CHIOP|nr:hypothetical protein GWK47_045379 [Chionoecetes opilio]
MQCLWRICVASVVIAAVVGDGVQGGEPWVWRQSSKASSIPGYVAPTAATTTTTTTPAPLVTTFRPPFPLEPQGRSAFRRASANPYFLMMVGPHRYHSHDGTTKSRVVVDTAFDGEGPEPLVLGDTYTTVDRLQSARGAPPRLPRPQKHQLGGLHPDEVFYANDDLLITRGGGFHSQVFQEPSQSLDEDYTEEDDIRRTHVGSAGARPPSPDQEYNGNIPIIVPPPPYTSTKPFSFLVGKPSYNNYMMVPYVYPRPYAKVAHTYPAQVMYRHKYYRSPPMLQAVRPLALPHSLVGDTDVNFRHPRPPINPDAEVFKNRRYPTQRRPFL